MCLKKMPASSSLCASYEEKAEHGNEGGPQDRGGDFACVYKALSVKSFCVTIMTVLTEVMSLPFY